MPGRAGSGCKHPTQLPGAASIPSDTSSRVAAPCQDLRKGNPGSAACLRGSRGSHHVVRFWGALRFPRGAAAGAPRIILILQAQLLL